MQLRTESVSKVTAQELVANIETENKKNVAEGIHDSLANLYYEVQEQQFAMSDLMKNISDMMQMVHDQFLT